MRTATDPVGHLVEMRRAFDLSFTRPQAERPAVVDLLAVTVGGDALAIRVDAVSGLVTDRPVTRLPGSPPALLGIAGLRGHLVPVYDLAAVLGAALDAPDEPDRPACLILLTGAPAVAVAVDRVDAHLRIPRDALAEPVSAGPDGGRTPAVVHTVQGSRPVVDVAAVRAAIASLSKEEMGHAPKHHV